MFELDDNYRASLDNYVGGKARSTMGEVYDAQRLADIFGGQTDSETTQYRNMIESNGTIAREQGVETPFIPPHAVASLRDNLNNGDEIHPHLRGQIDAYNNTIIDLRRANPKLALKSLEEMVIEAPLIARAAADDAARVGSRATGGDRFWGTAGAGVVSGFQEPLNVAAMVATLPFGLASFSGGLALQSAKLGLLEATVGGTAELMNQAQLVDFYERQGFSRDEINHRVWTSVGFSALGGAILAPAAELGFRGLGAGLRKIMGTTPEERLAGLGEIERSGLPLNTDQRADLANLRAALELERTNPFVPSAESSRAHTQTLDNLIAGLERGEGLDPFNIRTPLDPVRRGVTAGDLRTTTALRSLDITTPQTHGVAQAQADAAAAVVRQFETTATDIESRIGAATTAVETTTARQTALAAAVGRTPSPDDMTAAGVDPAVVARLSAIDAALMAKPKKAAKAELVAERQTIIDDNRPLLDAAHERTRAELQAANTAQFAAKAEAADLRTQFKQAREGVERSTAHAAAAQARATRLGQAAQRGTLSDEITSSIERTPRVITAEHAARETAAANDIVSGKYDDALIAEAYRVLEQRGGDIHFTDDAGTTISMRNTLQELDEEEAVLREIMSCVIGG